MTTTKNSNSQPGTPIIPRGADEHSAQVEPQPSGTDSAGRHVRNPDVPTPPTMREQREQRAPRAEHAKPDTAADLDDKVEGDEAKNS